MQIDLLVFVNIVLGAGLFLLNLVTLRLMSSMKSWRWLKAGYGILGLLWALLYLLLVVGILNNSSDPQEFSAKIVRPLVTLTLGVLCSSSIVTFRRCWADLKLQYPEASTLQLIIKLFRRDSWS